MDRISSAPYANNYENVEELKHLLVCASLELERTRTTAEFQNQVSEAKLQHLNLLLDTTRRERDEAREQLHKLKQRLAEYMAHNVGPNTTYVRSQWPDTKLADMDNLTSVCSPPHPHPVLDPVTLQSQTPQVGFDEQPWDLSPHHQNLQDEVHRPTTSSPIDHHHHHHHQADCSNLAEKETFYQVHDAEQQQQHNKLRYVHQHEPPDRQHQVEPGLLPLEENPITAHDVWQQDIGGRQASNAAAMLEIPEHESGHMAYHQGVLPSLNLSLPVHLPEPPEANMEVMLSNLPERGKLLQAVMQAGPLLQTLLLAGPLPQWRHPPPAMESVEIPRLSMGSLPPPLHVGHMQQPPLVTAHHSPALDVLQVSSPISSSQHSPPPSVACSIIDSDLQPTPTVFLSGTASGTAKFICGPMLNSQDSAKPGLRFQYTKIR